MKQIALLCVDILEETDPSGLMPKGDYYDAGLKLGESLDASSDVKEILDHMRNILAEPYDEEKAEMLEFAGLDIEEYRQYFDDEDFDLD